MSSNPLVQPNIRVAPLPLLNPWRERIEQAKGRSRWWILKGRFIEAEKLLAFNWQSCATSYYPFERNHDGDFSPNDEFIRCLGQRFYNAVRDNRVADASCLLDEIERQGTLLQKP